MRLAADLDRALAERLSARRDARGADRSQRAYLVRALSRDDLQIDGGGILPGGPSNEISVRARFHAAARALRRTSIEAHEVNALEQWMVNGKAILGLPQEDPSDGFVYEGYRLTSSEDVFVTGRIVRGGEVVERVLLR